MELRHSAKYSKSEEPSVSWMGTGCVLLLVCHAMYRNIILSMLYYIMLHYIVKIVLHDVSL